MISVEFWVAGRPCPQGSKTAFVRGRRAVMVESCRGLPAWRDAVATAANDARPPGWDDDAPAYVLDVEFYFARPKAHARLARQGKAPRLHSVRPDGDKLMRAIGDSLTGVLWRDDSRASVGRWVKLWSDASAENENAPSQEARGEGALIRVRLA